jgi:SAM-dependent methyltransferase
VKRKDPRVTHQTSRSEDWWGCIEQLHWEIVRSWVRSRTTRQPFTMNRGILTTLVNHSLSPASGSVDIENSGDAQYARTLTKLREHLMWGLRKINQFQILSEDAQQSINQMPILWLSELRGQESLQCGAQVEVHIQTATRTYLQNLDANCVAPDACQPISEEYSAELQLKVLHLSLAEIQEPVLDLGCGKDAFLVHWLKCQGRNALGIDLCANLERGCVAVDWFKFPFVPGYFGTIVAHLSFSLHFLKHHLDPKGDAESFAKQYMNILRALKVGGRMVYAPGLPFIERLLPERSYRVSRFVVEDYPTDAGASELYTSQLGDDPLYACHVERLELMGG